MKGFVPSRGPYDAILERKGDRRFSSPFAKGKGDVHSHVDVGVAQPRRSAEALGEMKLRDFTLYLHGIDSTRFSADQSRFGMREFADEWRAAWQAYKDHIRAGASERAADVVAFADSDWRQDLRSPLSIRKKSVTRAEFDVTRMQAHVSVENPVIQRNLDFVYDDVVDFRWTSRRGIPADPLEERYPILYLEEFRFAPGEIEHEIRFLGGATLLIVAKQVRLNLKEYLGS